MTPPALRWRWKPHEILQRLHLRPKRTVRVIAWMDEESGGAGSQAYTKQHLLEFPKHVAAIESDSGARIHLASTSK